MELTPEAEICSGCSGRCFVRNQVPASTLSKETRKKINQHCFDPVVFSGNGRVRAQGIGCDGVVMK